MIKILVLILLPVMSFGQFTIERIAYDSGPGGNDTLWTRDGSNKDTLFRRVAGVFQFGNKPYFRKLWTSVDVMDWDALYGTKLNTNGSAANLTSFPTLNQNTTGTAGGLSANIAQSQVTNLVSDLALKAPLTSATLVTPIIGVATGTSLTATGLIKSSGTAGIGYATGAGGTVTQATSKTTGVTLNKICGQITMNGAALAAAAEVSFTVTNSTVVSTDVVMVNIQSVGTAGSYFVTVGAVANGSFSVTVGNASAASLSQAIVLNFIVIKSVSN